MPIRTISATLAAVALVTALAGPDDGSDPPRSGTALADTVTAGADWLALVTMEPIRVVVTRDARLEAVTMEPIRVFIPRPEGAGSDPKQTPRR